MMKLLYRSSNIQLFISLAYLSLQKFYIQHIIIHRNLTFEGIQQLINAFPHLKFLELNIKENDLELIIRFLLKHIDKNLRLHLLGPSNLHPTMIDRLQQILDHEKLVENYSMKYIFSTVYLWW